MKTNSKGKLSRMFVILGISYALIIYPAVGLFSFVLVLLGLIIVLILAMIAIAKDVSRTRTVAVIVLILAILGIVLQLYILERYFKI
jgi:hypothetical protein